MLEKKHSHSFFEKCLWRAKGTKIGERCIVTDLNVAEKITSKQHTKTGLKKQNFTIEHILLEENIGLSQIFWNVL